MKVESVGVNYSHAAKRPAFGNYGAFCKEIPLSKVFGADMFMREMVGQHARVQNGVKNLFGIPQEAIAKNTRDALTNPNRFVEDITADEELLNDFDNFLFERCCC